MDLIFAAGNLVAVLGWLFLLAAIFSSRHRERALAIGGLAVPALLAAAYVALLVALATSGTAAMDLSSLDGVKAALSTDAGAVVGWHHYLAFDLFVGGWITRDALSRGVNRWLLPPVLLLTFMVGPVGLLAYLGLRAAASRSAKASPA